MGKPIAWTDVMIAELRGRLRKEESHRSIGERFGVCHKTIGRMARDLGFGTRERAGKPCAVAPEADDDAGDDLTRAPLPAGAAGSWELLNSGLSAPMEFPHPVFEDTRNYNLVFALSRRAARGSVRAVAS